MFQCGLGWFGFYDSIRSTGDRRCSGIWLQWIFRSGFCFDHAKGSISARTLFCRFKNCPDDNTLLDDCGSQLPEGESISFEVLPPHATPFDSLVPPHCAPTTLQLFFSDLIQCVSISPDGSDFSITGPTPVDIISASGNCKSGRTNVINIRLSAPLVAGGNYQLTLKAGNDGNTIINECGVETTGGGVIPFEIKDTVSASFDYSMNLGCNYDTLHLNYIPANGVDQW